MASTVFNHIGLSVDNVENEVLFYSRAFDMAEEFRFRIEEEGIEAVVLRSKDGWGIEIMNRSGSTARTIYDSPNSNLKTQGYGHFCIRVTNIQEMFDKLLSLGATSISPPGPAPLPAITFAYVADPEGHFVELIQIPEGLGL